MGTYFSSRKEEELLDSKIKVSNVRDESGMLDFYKSNMGSLKIIKEDSYYFSSRATLLITDKIKEIAKRFRINQNDNYEIKALYESFKRIDIHKTGFIHINSLYYFLEEDPKSSIISPFLDRLFLLCNRRYVDFMCFEEFLPNLISFCLFSRFQIVDFVFNFIDNNRDGFISKEDLRNYLLLERNGIPIFWMNNLISLERYDFPKNDSISLDDFCEFCNKNHYAYFPSIMLQEHLRAYFVGEAFWLQIQVRINKYQADQEKVKEHIVLENKLKEIKENLNQAKIEAQRKKFDKANADANGQNIYKREVRFNPFRKNTDTSFVLYKCDLAKKERREMLKKKLASEITLPVKDLVITRKLKILQEYESDKEY